MFDEALELRWLWRLEDQGNGIAKKVRVLQYRTRLDYSFDWHDVPIADPDNLAYE